VRGSGLPLSIIIVGVGNADFTNMDVLDSDDARLYSRRFKKYMDADIVQFVPFREFRNNPVQLARETLDEVPRQLLDAYRKRGIVPMPTDPAKKRAIQAKLAAQSNKAGFKQAEEGNEFSSFYADRKRNMIRKAVNMGMDHNKVEAFINNHGMYEEDV